MHLATQRRRKKQKQVFYFYFFELILMGPIQKEENFLPHF
jgi:hypothetical protein